MSLYGYTMNFILHKQHTISADMEKMRQLYEDMVYSDFLLFQYQEDNLTPESFENTINLPEVSINTATIEEFNKNNIELNKLFKNWFLQLGFFEDEKLYQRINGLDKIILSAKYGKPFAYRYENLIPVENIVLNNKRNLWQHFYGVTCLYNEKEVLERKDKAKRRLAEEKRAEAKQIEPLHSYNKFIEFLCPELNGRILFWGEYDKAFHKANSDELDKFFNWIEFYRNFLSLSPMINFEMVAKNQKTAFELLKRYSNSYISSFSTSHWRIITEFLREFKSSEKQFVEIQEDLVNSEYAKEITRNFELLALLFDVDKYLVNAKYNGDLFYCLNTKDKEDYENWELANQDKLTHFSRVIKSTEENRKTNKLVNIRTLENHFEERLRHNFYPLSKNVIDEWISKRLNYELYLNAEYAIKQISLHLFKNEGFDKTSYNFKN